MEGKTRVTPRAVLVAVLAAIGCDSRYLVGVEYSGDAATGSGGAAIGSGGAATGSAGGSGAPAGSGGVVGTGGLGVGGGPSGTGGGSLNAGCRPPRPVPELALPSDISRDEIARRLAQLLWRQPADAALRAATAAPALITERDVRLIAEQMLGDPRAAAGVDAFARSWLELDRVNSALVPSLMIDNQTRADMIEATLRLFRHLALDARLGFSSLLAGQTVFMNERLAPIYDRTLPPGSGWTESVDTRRVGVLSQLARLTADGTPTPRGLWIRKNLLCEVIPPHPANVTKTTMDTGMGTRRARQEAVINSAPVCTACHSLIDPLGYAFEHFDDAGRYRELDNGLQIDSSGNVSPGLLFIDPFSLLAQIGDRCEAQRCYVAAWMAHALGDITRAPSITTDPSMYGPMIAFIESNLNLATLIAAVAASPAFLTAPP
jgi:hypothetical protein